MPTPLPTESTDYPSYRSASALYSAILRTCGFQDENFDIALYSLLAKFESLKHVISALEALYRVFTESQFPDSSAYS